MRETDLSLDALFRELEMPKLSLPRCLIVNEIGEIFLASNDEKAKTKLKELLNSNSESDRFISFCCILSADDLDEESRVTLEEFENDPKNAEFIEAAKISVKNKSRVGRNEC